MIAIVDNYLKVLIYLKTYSGDGQMHNVETILGLNRPERNRILNELAKEGFIELYGGQNGSSIHFGDGKSFGGGYIPAEARVTLKGLKYLKEEMEMIDNNKYNIHIGDNSTANLIMHSPGAVINNKSEVISKAKEILETIEQDSSIASNDKNNALKTVHSFISEVEGGTPSQTTVNNLLTIGSNISSIGSLVLSLLQLLTL